MEDENVDIIAVTEEPNKVTIMNRWKMLVWLLLPIFFGSHTLNNPYRFSAYIVQDGEKLYIDEHVVKVKKAPFQIVMDLPDREGVFVNASFSEKTFNQLLTNVRWEKISGFSKVAIQEVWNNPTGELIVSKTQPCYWFIHSERHHRFTSYEHLNERYMCIRDVNFFYDLENKKEVAIEDVNTPLYLGFIKFATLGENRRASEIMRHELKIEWIE